MVRENVAFSPSLRTFYFGYELQSVFVLQVHCRFLALNLTLSFYQEIFLYNCKKNKIPILDYNEICTRSRNDLVFYLSSLQYHLDYDKWSEVICDTRKENEKNFKEFKSKWVVDCYGAIMI